MGAILTINTEDRLKELLGRMIRFRWFVVIGELIITSITAYFLPKDFPYFRSLSTIIALAILNIFFLFYFRYLESKNASFIYYKVFAHIQIIIDILLFTIYLHFLGGIETPFFFFFLIHSVVACFLFSRSISFLYVGLINTFYIYLMIFEGLEIIHHYNLVGFCSPLRFQQPIHIVASSFSLALSSFLIAYFTTNILVRLRNREKELMESNIACELKTKELAEANLACELKTKELAEANLSCELKTKELQEKTYELEIKTKELAELNKRLEELDKVRVQFIWLVTHELRAPIAGIQSYLKLILEGYVPPEKQLEIIQKAERLARKQLELINDLLQLTKLQEPEEIQKSEFVPVNMAEILDGVKDMMSARASERDISFDINIDPDLPLIKANAEHIKQLWTNLISNAIKYNKPGGKISIDLVQDTDHIIGKVSDTGIGISSEELPFIFDDFFRARNAKNTETDGTGLGLSIVKRIIENYDGKIFVESEIGKGTCFTLMIPKSSKSPLAKVDNQ